MFVFTALPVAPSSPVAVAALAAHSSSGTPPVSGTGSCDRRDAELGANRPCGGQRKPSVPRERRALASGALPNRVARAFADRGAFMPPQMALEDSPIDQTCSGVVSSTAAKISACTALLFDLCMTRDVSFTAVYEAVEDGWIQARVRELPEVITAAPTMEEAKELLLDALLEYLRSLGDEAVVDQREPLAEGRLQISLSA
jgi:predicted RNase H-like HicB family nuclease